MVTGADQITRDSRLRERSSKELDRIAMATKRNEVNLAHYKERAKIYSDKLNAQDAEVRRLKGRVNKLLARCFALEEKVQDYNDGMIVLDWL